MKYFPVKECSRDFVIICFLVIASIFAFSRCGWAYEFRVIPSLAITEKYNDNIGLAEKSENPQRDWITTITPGLLLGTRTERLDATLSGRLDGNYYAKYDHRNKWDQLYNGNIRYQATDRLGLGAHAGYSILYSEDSDIETTGLVQPSGRRDRTNAGASIDYLLGSLTTAALSYDYDKTRYDEQEDNDSWGQTAGLGLTRQLSATTKGRMNFGYSNYHYTDNTVDSYKGTLASAGISAQGGISCAMQAQILPKQLSPKSGDLPDYWRSTIKTITIPAASPCPRIFSRPAAATATVQRIGRRRCLISGGVLPRSFRGL